MHRGTSIRSVLLVSALGTALLGSCSKKEASTTVSSSPSEAVPVAVSKAPKVARKADDSSGTLLRFLPRDSSAVVGLNWSKARKNEIVRSFDAKILEAVPKMADAESKCGLDPLTAVHSMAVGLGADPSNDDAMVVALSGAFTRLEFEACVRAYEGKVDGNRYSDSVNVYWPLSNVVVFSAGVSSEQLALAPSASAWDNDKLMVLVDELDLHATLWVAGMVPASLSSTFGSLGAAPWGGYLTLDLKTGLQASMGLEFEDAEQAQAMMKTVDMGLTMLKGQPPMDELLDSVTTGVADLALVVVGQWTAAELEQMQMMLKQAGVL